MEMNPFKPLIQSNEEFLEKLVSLKISLTKLYLKINMVKATT